MVSSSHRLDTARSRLLLPLTLLLLSLAGCSNSGDEGGGSTTLGENPLGALLDGEFGSGDGLVFLSSGDGVAKTVIEGAAGELFVAGEVIDAGGDATITVWKLTATGGLDGTFNGNGIATLDPSPGVSPNENSLAAMVIDDLGRIILAGTAGDPADPDVFVARLLPSGAPDASFGAGSGIVTAENDDLGVRFDTATAVTVDATNRITVLGTSIDGSLPDESEMVAWRFTEIGLADGGFGAAGLFTSGGLDDEGGDLIVDDFGQTLIVGRRDAALAVWLLDADGSLEVTFGSGGLSLLSDPSGGTLHARDAKLWADASGFISRAIVTGTRTVLDLPDRLFSARISLIDGSLDGDYGGTGVTLLGTVFGDAAGYESVVASDGRTVAAAGITLDDGAGGTTGAGSLWLLFPSGLLDPALGGTGAVHLSSALDAVSDARGLVIDAASRVVVVGSADTGVGTISPVIWRVP